MKIGDYVKTKDDMKISLNGYIIGLGCTYEVEDVWESHIKLKGVVGDIYFCKDDFEVIYLNDKFSIGPRKSYCAGLVYNYILDPNQPEDMTSSDYYHGYRDFNEDNLNVQKIKEIGLPQQKGVIYNSCGYSFLLTEDELKWVSSVKGLKFPSAKAILRRRELKAEIERIENE